MASSTAIFEEALSPPDRARPAPSMFTVRHCVLFLTVLILAAATPAIPHNAPPNGTWWLLAWALLTVLVATCFLATRQAAGHWSQTVAPLLAFPVVQLLRTADGYSQSGFSPLYFLPVVFFVLYGKRRDVLIALMAALVALLAPILFIGAPEYPATGLRGALLLFLMFAAVGTLVNELVLSLRQMTRRLHLSETRYRAAFNDAPLAMVLTAVSGPRAGSFIRVNRAACELFGRSADDLTTMPIARLTHPDDVALTARIFATANDPQAEHRIEKRYLHSSGRTIWAAASFSVIYDDEGAALYFVTQIENIGDRRESDRALLDALESERSATERMRELDTFRNELMSGVVHDLRTPLTAAAGFAELLGDETVGPLTTEQHGLVQTISRNLSRLAGMVDELVTTTRGGRHHARRIPWREVDVDELVGEVIQATAMAMQSKHLTISATGSASGARVLGDTNRLDRALVNLMGNAAKFTPAGGTISIHTSSSDEEVVIRIADTGIGIPLADQSRIFERFYRSEHAVGKDIGGTGLGLAIVREIITQHGGDIRVDSEPGRGATFTLSLPLATARTKIAAVP